MTTPEDPDDAARARANAVIRDGEQRIQRAWFRSLTRWMDRVRPDVLADSGPSPQRIGQHAAFWGQLMTDEVVPESASLYQRIRDRVTQRPEPVTDPAAAQFLNEVGNRLVRIPDEVYARIVREIETGISEGESNQDMAARVRTVLTATGSELWPNRAITVARTESLAAVNAGAYAGALREAERRGDPAPFKVWLCVAPDTAVAAVSVKAAARRHYVGPLVRIATASGAAVSVTPEHPVLTGRGWVAAHLVDQRDHLFHVAAADPSGAPDVEHPPIGIGQVIDTLMESEPVKVRTVRVGMDLDSDSVNGDIQVVPVDGHLPGHGESVLRQSVGNLLLVHADRLAHVLCLGICASGELVGQHAPATEFGSRSLGLGGFEFDTLPRSAQDTGLTFATHGLSRLHQDPDHGGTGASDLSGHTGDGQAGAVQPDQVTSVDVISFSGHVYDLTTESGWYVGNSLLLHNSTEDTRTRPTHDAADKQRTLLSSPFVVGGASLQYPGDPRGPATEVINCRCSFLPIVLGETLDWTDRQQP